MPSREAGSRPAPFGADGDLAGREPHLAKLVFDKK